MHQLQNKQNTTLYCNQLFFQRQSSCRLPGHSCCLSTVVLTIDMFPFFFRNIMDNYFTSETICEKNIPKVEGFGGA